MPHSYSQCIRSTKQLGSRPHQEYTSVLLSRVTANSSASLSHIYDVMRKYVRCSVYHVAFCFDRNRMDLFSATTYGGDREFDHKNRRQHQNIPEGYRPTYSSIAPVTKSKAYTERTQRDKPSEGLLREFNDATPSEQQHATSASVQRETSAKSKQQQQLMTGSLSPASKKRPQARGPPRPRTGASQALPLPASPRSTAP